MDKPLTPPAQCLYLSHGESHITDLKGLLLDQVSEPRMHWHNTHSIKLLPLQLALALLRLGQKKLVPGCLPHFPLQPIISFCCCLSFTFIAPPPSDFLLGLQSIHPFVGGKQTSSVCGSTLREAERRKTGSVCKDRGARRS